MPKFKLTSGEELVLDAQDFERVQEKFQTLTRIQLKTGIVYIDGWLKERHSRARLTAVLYTVNSSMSIRFRDGNDLNWRRSNIFFTSKRSKVSDGRLEINATHCQLGPAILLLSKEGERSPACIDCNNPSNDHNYELCLNAAAFRNWDSWIRKPL